MVDATAASSQALVLNVGSDQTVQKILKLGFQESPYRVVNLATARDAYQYCQENEVAYLIIDSHLPDMPGLHFAEKIKQHFEGCYILMLTDYLDLEATIKALDGPVDEYLLKPVRFDQVLSIIRRFDRLKNLQSIINAKTRRIAELEAEIEGLRAQLQQIYPTTAMIGNTPTPSASQQRQMQALSSYAQHAQKSTPNENES